MVTTSFEAKAEEYEIEIYLRGYDIEQIKDLAVEHEHQEQWSIFIPKSEHNSAEGSIRVRKTTGKETTTCVLAIKTHRSEGSKDEDEYEVDDSAFDMMKALAVEGMIKMRYMVPHTSAGRDPVVYEVDVFYDKSNTTRQWVKIDLETIPGTRITPDDIPFKYSEIIIVHPEEKQNDQKLSKRLKTLYMENFICRASEA